MSFYVSLQISDLVNNLRMILDETRRSAELQGEHSTSKPRLLVFNSGYHELAFNSSATYIAHTRHLLDVLQELMESGMFRVIFQNIPPWPHHLEHDSDRHLNTQVNAATNYWLNTKLLRLDIHTVDIYSLALPFENASECGMHFLCEDYPREPKGVAGREATQQILKSACKT